VINDRSWISPNQALLKTTNFSETSIKKTQLISPKQALFEKLTTHN
jgi:hypothetical protein